MASVSSHHFHVAVLGDDLSASATATLFAKEGYRVAWLRPANRQQLELINQFIPINLLSPIVSRYLGRVSLPASLVHPKRTMRAPLLMVSTDPRVECSGDRSALSQELQREYPEEWKTLLHATSEIFDSSRSLTSLLKSISLRPNSTWLERWSTQRFAEKIRLVCQDWDALEIECLPQNCALRSCFEFCTQLSGNDKRLETPLKCWHYQTWTKLGQAECVWQSDLQHVLSARFKSFGGTIIDIPSAEAVRKNASAPFQIEINSTMKSIGADCFVDLPATSNGVPELLEGSVGVLLSARTDNRSIPQLLQGRTIFAKTSSTPNSEALIQIYKSPDDETELLAYVRVDRADQSSLEFSAQRIVDQALHMIAPFAAAELKVQACLERPRSTHFTGRLDQPTVLGELARPVQREMSGQYQLSAELLTGFGPEGRLLAAEALCHVIMKGMPRKSWTKRRAWL